MSTATLDAPAENQHAQVKFFNKEKTFGFTEEDYFFHISGYRRFERNWRGLQYQVEAEPDYLPVDGQQIVVLSVSQGKQGKKITWCFPEDLHTAKVDLFVVLSTKETSETSEPVADNQRKLYKVETFRTLSVIPLFIGTSDGCDNFMRKNPHPQMTKKPVSEYSNGVKVNA